MDISHSVKSLVMVAGSVAVLWAAAPAAQARDVVWSVSVGSPGIHGGVYPAPRVVHARPIIVAPQPVYLPQPPVVVHPRAMLRYGQPVLVMAPQPYYYYAAPAWVPPGHRQGWRGRHGDRDDRRDHDRSRHFDRRDHR